MIIRFPQDTLGPHHPNQCPHLLFCSSVQLDRGLHDMEVVLVFAMHWQWEQTCIVAHMPV